MGVAKSAQGPTFTSKIKPISPFACYDNINNSLWNYSELTRRVARWANTGPSLLEQSGIDKHTKVLDASDKIQQHSFTPQQAALYILAHMDRLVRQHGKAGEAATHKDSVKRCFCVEPCLALYSSLRNIMSHSSSGTDKQEGDKYVLAACTRILRVNIQELVITGLSLDLQQQESELLLSLRALLTQLVHDDSSCVQQEACHILALGLELFFPSHDEQTSFLLSLIENTKDTKNTANKVLLEAVLSQLADWDHAPDILLEGSGIISISVKNDTQKMEIDTPAAAPVTPIQSNKYKNAYKLLCALVNYVVDETRTALDNASLTVPATPLVGAPLRLLLSLQRTLVAQPSYKNSGLVLQVFREGFCGLVRQYYRFGCGLIKSNTVRGIHVDGRCGM